MKPYIKIILFVIGVIVWYFFLCLTDWMFGDKFDVGGLPSPWGELLAVAVNLGPPIIAGLFVLRSAYPFHALHSIVRWTIYFIVSSIASIGAYIAGILLMDAFRNL